MVRPSATLPLRHLAAQTAFFDDPAFVVLKSTSGAMNSLMPNKSVYLSAKSGLVNVIPSQIIYPFLQ